MSHFNFENFLLLFEQKGRELYGEHFRVLDSDREVLFRLAIYFAKDEESSKRCGISFNKGILLNGPVGCGKTAIMSIFRLFLKKENSYAIKSCRNISFLFLEYGHSVIKEHSRVSFEKYHQNNYCFDDLGTEGALKLYGNECNVMGEILLSRYDSFVSQKIYTHITTNLTSTEIGDAYGTRVRSRMREMFNLISFDKTTPDKRA